MSLKRSDNLNYRQFSRDVRQQAIEEYGRDVYEGKEVGGGCIGWWVYWVVGGWCFMWVDWCLFYVRELVGVLCGWIGGCFG